MKLKELKFNEKGELTLDDKLINATPIGHPKSIRVINTMVGYSWSEGKLNLHIRKKACDNANSYIISFGLSDIG